jgi:excisionase family DNA binding protein
MREFAFKTINDSETEELLTTGEAARMLNSSRQHVVDLCERGDLPFTTVGVHRRVCRADVEAIRARTQRLSRDQRRSLWLAYATAGRIVGDPERALGLAKNNLAGMMAQARGSARRWLEEWEQLLDGPIGNVLAVLVSPSPKGREMRQNSPFAGLLSDAERVALLDSWKIHDGEGRR